MTISLPRSGISYSPTLEHELARQWSGVPPSEWAAMDGDQQARYVALHRVYFQMEGVVAKARTDEARRGRSKYGK